MSCKTLLEKSSKTNGHIGFKLLINPSPKIKSCETS